MTAQSGAQLNAVMFAEQLGNPVDEHADLARQVSILRVDDAERRRLGEPIPQQQFQAAALHRLLEHEGGNLRYT